MSTARPRHPDARLARVVDFFEQLTPADLARLDQVYAADAQFKDPFNDVQGLEAIRAIFAHMFATLGEPRFVVHDLLVQGDQAFLRWDFHFRAPRLGPGLQTIRGATHLLLAGDGRVAVHRDYWDAAEELYEKLPLLGTLMRWLRRRASAGPR